MKSSELLKLAKKNGWRFCRDAKGSHEIWEKNGIRVVIPNHGSKEVPKGLERKLKKQMGLK